MKLTPEQIQAKLDSFNKAYKENGWTDGKILSIARYEKVKLNGQDKEFLENSFLSAKAKEKAKLTYIERYGKPAGAMHTPEKRKKAYDSRIKKYGNINGNMMTPEAIAKKIEKYGSINGAAITPEARAKAVKKIKKPVLQYDLKNNFIKEWPSAKDVQLQLNISSLDIGACARGEQKTAKGFIWKYKLD